MSHNANSNCSRAWILLWENLILKVCHSELTGDGHWENQFIFLISSSQSRPLELRIWTFVQVRHFVSWRFHILVLDLKRLLPQMSTIDRDSVFQSNPQLYKIPCGHFYSVAAMNNQFTAKVWKRSMFVTRLHPFQMFMEPPYKAPTAPYQDECSCFAFIWFSVDFCFFSRLIERKSGVRPDFFDCSTKSSFVLSGQRSQVHLCTWKKYEFVLAIALVKLFQEQIKMDIFLIETWNKEHGQGGGKAGKWNKENKVMQSVLNSK